MDHGSLFKSLAVIFSVGFGVSFLLQKIKQPLILGYIITGIICGPILNLIHSAKDLEGLATLGVALLLFLIGIELNPKNLKDLKSGALQIGLMQIIFTFLFFAAVFLFFKTGFSAALVAALAMVFSSTIVGLKSLTDKKEQNRLYGRIAIGVLLLQDVIATLSLLLLSIYSGGGTFSSLLILILKGILLTSAIAALAKFVLPKVIRAASASSEVLFIFSLAWGIGIAELFVVAGFSLEVGAIIAGISLASSRYSSEISAKLKPVKDFFVTIFFVLLGFSISIQAVRSQLLWAVLTATSVVIIKPIVIFTSMSSVAHTKRNSFKTAMLLSQISEFSLILMTGAFAAGLINQNQLSLVALVAVVSITISSYGIKYDDQIFNFLRSKSKIFGSYVDDDTNKSVSPKTYDFIQVGWRKGGAELAKAINVHRKSRTSFLVIDHDPDVIDELAHLKRSFIYGEATNVEILDEVNFGQAKFISSALDDLEVNKFLLEYLANKQSRAVFIARAQSAAEAQRLYDLGASYVVVTHFIGSEKLNNFIARNGTSKKAFQTYREKHIKELEKSVSKKALEGSSAKAATKLNKPKKLDARHRKLARVFGRSALEDTLFSSAAEPAKTTKNKAK
jgi:Kef-type K+ transport system membrane component KefB/voltage-gated potassium channel Kch